MDNAPVEMWLLDLELGSGHLGNFNHGIVCSVDLTFQWDVMPRGDQGSPLVFVEVETVCTSAQLSSRLGGVARIVDDGTDGRITIYTLNTACFCLRVGGAGRIDVVKEILFVDLLT